MKNKKHTQFHVQILLSQGVIKRSKPRRARICWQSKVTGIEGKLDYVPCDIARNTKAELDQANPDFDHWLEYEDQA